VLYRARPRVITEGAELQKRILERAANWLKPDGVLVYSVCSLEPDEGERIVEASGLRVDPPSPGELPDFATPSPEKWVRILPGLLEDQGGLDGFFMARLVRRD
jgi:16S rRNA (cytosine967-C5)-methyltransferase